MRRVPAPGARPAITWGIGDVILVWFLALIASGLVIAIPAVLEAAPDEIGAERLEQAVERGWVADVELDETTDTFEGVLDEPGRAPERFRYEAQDGTDASARASRMRDSDVRVTTVGGTRPIELLFGLAAQGLAVIGLLALVARRKGMGSLAADFGLAIRPARRWLSSGPWLFAGSGLLLATSVMTISLNWVHGETREQGVVESLERAGGLELLLTSLAVVVLAPLAEELLFRGALLRSLLRRLDPSRSVLVSAFVFAAVHLLGDPSVGTLVALPPIFALGVVCAWQAVETGNLVRSVLLHAGFNGLTVLVLLTA